MSIRSSHSPRRGRFAGARRWQVVGTVGVAVAMVGVGLGVAGAATGDAAPTVNCPTVSGALPAIPAQAQAEVARNLALLNTQISEANQRLVTSRGQGGPNFIQNAILGPLEDKRTAVLNRIETAIGRNAAKPEGLERFATCTLNTGGGASRQEPAAPPAGGNNAGGNNAGGNNAGGNNAGGNNAAAGAPTVNCPSVDQVRAALPAVPAQAQAEVASNLQQLQNQINEANQRLITSRGQGGPNFIQNAILGPLADKRTAALNRIETAIGRNAPKPDGLERFATCSLNAPGAAGNAGNGNAGNAGNAGNGNAGNAGTANAGNAGNGNAANAGNGAAPTVNCPSVDQVRAALPAVPAQAQAEVASNLQQLQNQINEANQRLITSRGQGGPNFIQNAILGPLADKRTAALNRIETAIGRNAPKPDGLERFATCSLNN